MNSASHPQSLKAQPAAKSRLIQIDLLRGIAILLVFGAHSMLLDKRGNFEPFSLMQQKAGRLQGLSEFLHTQGGLGVDLFFVLSGFLVGGLLFQEILRTNGLDMKRFIVRRGFKIWPSYYVYLAFVVVLAMMTRHLSLEKGLQAIWPNLAHIQNYMMIHDYEGMALGHTWSLAVEEHFYLALPLLLYWMAKKGNVRFQTSFAIVVPLVIVACILFRVAHWVNNYPSIMWTYTHLRMDQLFIGVALAFVYHLQRERWQRLTRRPGLLFACGSALLLPALMDKSSLFYFAIGYTLVALGFGCILAAVVPAPGQPFVPARWHNFLVVRAIAFIGTYSYSIYLWHFSIGQWFPKWLVKYSWLMGEPELRWLILMAVYILSSTLIGVALGTLIEFPALTVRDRLFPSHVGNRATTRPGV